MEQERDEPVLAIEATSDMLEKATVLWNARAFDVDPRSLPAGWMQGRCRIAAQEIDAALAVEGITPRSFDQRIHPFDVTATGEPIHTAEAIVNHTRKVLQRAYDEVTASAATVSNAGRGHIETARRALGEVLGEFG